MVKQLTFPVTEEEIRGLTAGESVLISGRIMTGRDRVHHFLCDEKPGPSDLPFRMEGGLLYHCGPITARDGSGYRMIACGPTTSARVEIYQHMVIGDYGIRAVMGKGGMGEKTLAALQKSGAVYLHTIGGAAVVLGRRVKQVLDVWKLDEFGAAEAMWLLEVENFPAIVTMDSHGNNLHEEIRKESEKAYRELLKL